MDGMDTGFVQTSANDLGIKMMSRQCVLIKGKGETKGEAPFDKTDAPMFCKQINSDALNWALANASPGTKERFQK